MRDAVSKLGSDPNKINPLVSTQSNAIHNFWRFVFFFLTAISCIDAPYP